MKTLLLIIIALFVLIAVYLFAQYRKVQKLEKLVIRLTKRLEELADAGAKHAKVTKELCVYMEKMDAAQQDTEAEQ